MESLQADKILSFVEIYVKLSYYFSMWKRVKLFS